MEIKVEERKERLRTGLGVRNFDDILFVKEQGRGTGKEEKI